jgi:hypothetical protein
MTQLVLSVMTKQVVPVMTQLVVSAMTHLVVSVITQLVVSVMTQLVVSIGERERKSVYLYLPQLKGSALEGGGRKLADFLV